MKRTLIVGLIFSALAVPAHAAPSAKSFAAACMAMFDNGTPKKCACVGVQMTRGLDANEQVYAHAILTLDESKLSPINGNFKDATSVAVQAKLIPLIQHCKIS